ncbi:hypothetical protein U9M48_033749 [Paspalum notatum var. saurae]|uniref:Uncharacterized protein n=1 Tax=Paspalum notatum var. saurae TaxID=547442 RepID=A0AAQ3X6I3_PASNO
MQVAMSAPSPQGSGCFPSPGPLHLLLRRGTHLQSRYARGANIPSRANAPRKADNVAASFPIGSPEAFNETGMPHQNLAGASYDESMKWMKNAEDRRFRGLKTNAQDWTCQGLKKNVQVHGLKKNAENWTFRGLKTNAQDWTFQGLKTNAQDWTCWRLRKALVAFPEHDLPHLQIPAEHALETSHGKKGTSLAQAAELDAVAAPEVRQNTEAVKKTI